MGYYVRALCTSKKVPIMKELISWLDDHGHSVQVMIEDPNEQLSPDWESFELVYNKDKQPIPVECNRNSGEDSLAKAEAQEFLDEIEEEEDSPAKQKVVDHLNRIEFIICCRLLGDVEEDGYDVNGIFLDYFVQNCGAIIHADGEGFYSDSETVLLET